MPDPFVSVVIPVYEDADALAICLDGIDRQTYPAQLREVVVVDNGSSGDLSGVVSGRAGVSLIRCPKPGSYAARNRGVAAARGPVIAFTDADCLPRDDWLESGVAALRREPEVAVLGGHVEVLQRNGVALSAAELYQHVTGFPQQRYLESLNFFATANLFTYKHVFDRIGPFDERLLSSGDFEWGQRAHARGLRQMFCPDAVAAHPARATLPSLLRKSARIAGGQFVVRRLRAQSQVPAMAELAGRALRRTFGDGPHADLPWRDRVRFVGVEWAIVATRVLETLRLMSGGTPRRR